jgi:hypothetical protein
MTHYGTAKHRRRYEHTLTLKLYHMIGPLANIAFSAVTTTLMHHIIVITTIVTFSGLSRLVSRHVLSLHRRRQISNCKHCKQSSDAKKLIVTTELQPAY